MLVSEGTQAGRLCYVAGQARARAAQADTKKRINEIDWSRLKSTGIDDDDGDEDERSVGLKHTEKQMAGWKLLTSGDKTRILFDGGARSGKTVLVIEYMIMRALRFPGCRQLIVRRHRVHAYASIWDDTLRDYLKQHVAGALFERSTSRMLCVTFRNGSQIIVDGLDNEERVDKLLGNEYATVFVNEARQTTWRMAQILMTRLAQKVEDSAGGLCVPKLIFDTNPAGPKHWLHRVAVELMCADVAEPLPDADNWGRLNWSAYDNTEHLPASFVAALEALPHVERERMLHGRWVRNEGLVYPDFDSCLVEDGRTPDRRVIDAKVIRREGNWYGGIDWGFNNPFCALVGVLDKDDVLWVVRCRYRKRTTLATHASKLPHDVTYYADPSGADQIAELRRADHVIRKAPNSIPAGIAAVTARMRDGRLKIIKSPQMQPLLQEAYGYAYPEDRDDERPEDKDNHAMDALRYLVAGVDRGRTALLWEDEADDETEPSPDEAQKRYAPATARKSRTREERLPDGHSMIDSDKDWMHRDNEALWEDLS